MTPHIPVKNGLQLDEDHRFERADWRAQRIGWAAMALLLTLALAGALGRGTLSDEQLPFGAGDTLLVESVVRRQAQTELQLKVRSTRAESLLVEISPRFLRHVDIRAISPEPAATRLHAGRTQYLFQRLDQEPVEVTFVYTPTGYWRNRGWLSVAGSGRVHFSQVVLP